MDCINQENANENFHQIVDYYKGKLLVKTFTEVNMALKHLLEKKKNRIKAQAIASIILSSPAWSKLREQ